MTLKPNHQTDDQAHLVRYIDGITASTALRERKIRVTRFFVSWLHGHDLSLTNVRSADLDHFMTFMTERGRASERDVAATAVRQLLAEVFRDRPRAENPGAGWNVKRPAGLERHQRRLQDNDDHIFSMPDLMEIFQTGRVLAEKSARESRAQLYKVLAICELVYASGMNVKDLIELKIDTLTAKNEGYLELPDKLGSRMVPITKRAHDAIQTWVEESAEFGSAPDGEVFFLLRTNAPERPTTISTAIGKFGTKIGVRGSENLTVKNLRASFAAHLLNAGAAPELIAYVLDIELLAGIDRHLYNAKRILDVA